MRVNVYAEELTDRIEIIRKVVGGDVFTGLRIYLELPVRKLIDPAEPARGYQEHRGPFVHRDGDDDSSAVTFWGKQDLRKILQQAIYALDTHYAYVNEAPKGGAVRHPGRG
jgi:hypothetical protein